MEIGRLCIKLAGRDAGRACVVVDNLPGNFVLIDGNVRRRKCNIFHLEPLDQVVKIKKGVSHADVSAEFKKLKLDVWNTKPKKEKPQKPAAKRKQANVNKKVKKGKETKQAPEKAKTSDSSKIKKEAVKEVKHESETKKEPQSGGKAEAKKEVKKEEKAKKIKKEAEKKQ